MTFRSESLRRSVATLECMRCGRQGATQAAHSNQLRDGKARGLKASDAAIAALCVACHTEIDQGRAMSKQERREAWDEAHRATLLALIERGLLRVAA